MKPILWGAVLFSFCFYPTMSEAKLSRKNKLKKILNLYMIHFTENKSVTKDKTELRRLCQRRATLSRSLSRLDVVLEFYRKKRAEVADLLEDSKMVGVSILLMQKHEKLLMQLEMLNQMALNDAKRLVRACR